MLAIGCMGFGGPSVLEPLSLSAPVCGEEQVRIRVEGVSVNYADLQTRRGSYHAGGTQFPVIPGLDAVGIVETVGSRVDHIRVGQRVLAFPHTGTYAEYVVADGNLTFPVPEGLPLEQAIACPLVTFTSWMLLHKVAALEPGETLLIHAGLRRNRHHCDPDGPEPGGGKNHRTVGSPAKRQAALDAGADDVFCLVRRPLCRGRAG